MMPGFGGGMGGFGWIAMSFGWFVFLALAVAVMWLLLRTTTTNDTGRAKSILDERYARGEIDDQEYQQRLRTLGS